MKNGIKRLNWKMLVMFLFMSALQTILWAQESESTTTSTKKVDVSIENTETWYTSPWIWVVGAAVFILLLVALLSGGRSSGRTTDRVRVTKTVERDTDV